MTGKIAAATVLLLLLAGFSHGSEKIVSLATLTDFAPFCFPKESAAFVAVEDIPPGSDSKQLQGYSWEVVRESFHAMGYTVRLHVVPWERGMYYLTGGRVDGIFPANHTIERERDFVFSKAYVDQVKMVIYMHADTQVQWQGLESLNGLTIGYVRGWAYGKNWEVMDQIIKEPTDTIAQGFDMVGKGRLVGIAGYQQPYDFLLKRTKRSQEFKIVGHFDTVYEYLMGRRNDTNSLVILDVFDSGRKKIDENGVLSEIEKKWR